MDGLKGVDGLDSVSVYPTGGILPTIAEVPEEEEADNLVADSIVGFVSDAGILEADAVVAAIPVVGEVVLAGTAIYKAGQALYSIIKDAIESNTYYTGFVGSALNYSAYCQAGSEVTNLNGLLICSAWKSIVPGCSVGDLTRFIGVYIKHARNQGYVPVAVRIPHACYTRAVK
eukprot:gene7642-797_t